MKTLKFLLAGLLLTSTLAFQSCKDDDDDYDMDRQTFATEASSSNNLEINLSLLALQPNRATTVAVQQYAQMMINHHRTANTELAQLATAKGLTVLPESSLLPAHQQVFSNLNASAATGINFDKAYMAVMVSSHQDAERLFDNAEDEVNDAELRNFADQKLEIIRGHLQTAINLNTTLNNQQ